MSFNAKFSADSLTSLNFWQLAELLANADNVKKYLGQVKEAMQALSEGQAEFEKAKANALVATNQAAKDADLIQKQQALTADQMAKLQEAKAKYDTELKDKNDYLEQALADLQEKLNDVDSRSVALTRRSEQLEKEYQDKMADLAKWQEALAIAQEKLDDDQLVFETKQKALKEAIKSV